MSPKAKEIKPKPADPEDDSRTRISKTITWILRRGAKAVEIDIDAEGWVRIVDLLKAEGLQGVSIPELLQVIQESNVKKARYQVSHDGQKIRAYHKDERERMKVIVPPETATLGASAFPAPTSPMGSSMMNPYAGWPGFGYPGMMPWMMPGMMPGMLPGMAAAWPQGGGGYSNRYQGRIKSFNSEKGFGFIECYETYALHQRDVFLHKAQVGEMTVGQPVTFTCELNKQGMPQAKDVQSMGGLPMGGYATGGKGKDKGKGKGKGKGEKGTRGEGKGKGKKEKKEKEDAQEKTEGEKTEGEAGAAAPEAKAVAEPAAEAPEA